MLMYDFGCGNHKVDNCIGIDIDANSSADIVWDLTVNCPGLLSNSADVVYSRHVLEHIPHPHHFKFLAQIIRVLKVGGRFEIMVPHPGHDCAMVPDHKHWFTLQYIDDVIRTFPGLKVTEVIQKKSDLFPIIKKETNFDDELIFKVYRNVATELIVMGYKI
jgi:predicted SAM-dependent methyltransferase